MIFASMQHVMRLLGLLLIAPLSLPAYTFTSVDGREFEGELISVSDSVISVRRAFDGVIFEVAPTLFSAADQAYFTTWEPMQEPRTFRLDSNESIRSLPRQLRVDLIWQREHYTDFEVQRAETAIGEWITLQNPTPQLHVFSDYIGEPHKHYFYRVRGLVKKYQKITETGDWSDVVDATTTPYSREGFMEEVQEAAVRFYFEEAHPLSGLSPEGQPGWGDICAIGSTGMGMANIIVGVERGFVSREQGSALALKMLRFLETKAERHNGAWGHWLDGATGVTRNFGKQKNSVDLVETSFLIQGAILLREYFDTADPVEQELRIVANRLSQSVQWDAFMIGELGQRVMQWHWHPDLGFSGVPIAGFHEAMMPYLLGIASEDYPISVESFFSGWMNRGRGFGIPQEHFGVKHELGRWISWPLFFAHYSHIGFDPSQVSYSGKTYAEHFTDATRIHQLYSQSRADEFKGYDQLWGLAASLNPTGYRANHPGPKDDGTIATTAALSSMPYLPEAVKTCMETMYLDYGKELWGVYGFYNAINPSKEWVGQKYIGIELGPIAPMIENYRSGLLWRLFMQSPEAQCALKRLRENETTRQYVP
jgi:hypothetical protein